MENTSEQKVARLYARIEKALAKSGYTLEAEDDSPTVKVVRIRPLAYSRLLVAPSGAEIQVAKLDDCAGLFEALKGKVEAHLMPSGIEIRISHP